MERKKERKKGRSYDKGVFCARQKSDMKRGLNCHTSSPSDLRNKLTIILDNAMMDGMGMIRPEVTTSVTLRTMIINLEGAIWNSSSDT
jgi:hypothetical protein